MSDLDVKFVRSLLSFSEREADAAVGRSTSNIPAFLMSPQMKLQAKKVTFGSKLKNHLNEEEVM